MSCGLRLSVRASVIARFVVQSPNVGSRGRSTTGSIGSGAPSVRAALIRASRMIASGVTRTRTLRGLLARLRGLVARLCGTLRTRAARFRLAAVSRWLALVFLAVLAVVRDVETRTFEKQAGTARHDALSQLAAFRTLHLAFRSADRAEEVLERVALRAAILVRWHVGIRADFSGETESSDRPKSLQVNDLSKQVQSGFERGSSRFSGVYAGTNAPHSSRNTSATSPTVARARTALIMAGISDARSPASASSRKVLAVSRTSASALATPPASRFARRSANRVTWSFSRRL